MITRYLKLRYIFLLIFFSCQMLEREGNETLIKKAIKAQEQDMDDEAIKYLDKALNNDSTLIEAYLWKGEILNKTNKSRLALEVLKKALKIDSKNTAILFNLGVSYYFLDQFDSSLIYYNSAIASKGTDSIYIEFNKK